MGFAPKDVQFSRGVQRIGFARVLSDNWAIILIRNDFSFSESISFHFMDEKELEIFC